jgi:hypothetical protein
VSSPLEDGSGSQVFRGACGRVVDCQSSRRAAQKVAGIVLQNFRLSFRNSFKPTVCGLVGRNEVRRWNALNAIRPVISTVLRRYQRLPDPFREARPMGPERRNLVRRGALVQRVITGITQTPDLILTVARGAAVA